MSTEWFLHKEGTQYGPYTWEQLCEFARDGRLQPGDSVWISQMTGWSPAQGVTGLFPQEQLDGARGEGSREPRPGGGEEVLGIIPALNKKVSFFSSKTYTLVVTEKRLIFAELTNKMLNEAVIEAQVESKGKGFLKRWAETAASQQRIYNRYQNMVPDEILVENSGNFAINNSDVKSIRMRIGHFYEEQGQQESDTMLIHAIREKIKLTFNDNGSTGEAKKILWRALGNVVK